MDDSSPSRRSIVLCSIGVFAIAIIFRVPSCYESFWLDELHSAWCVWDSLGEVFPRAQIGNQSPFYFIGLWFWRQIVGDSEVALRFSSVFALAASSMVLTVSVARWTKSFAAGVTAGLVIALESNAIFFGTELRPYAFVILFASVALACFLRLSGTESRHRHYRYWSALIVAILLAAMCQPTSLGVLACLPFALCCVWLLRDRRQFWNVTLLDTLLGLTVTVVGFLLWRITLGETWRERTNWEAFAEATRVSQIVEVWDWKWLLIIPLSLVLVTTAVATCRKTISTNREVFATTLLLALIAIMATSMYWGVSRANWAPIWHRRYFIAVLPVLACVAGGSVGIVESLFRPLRTASGIALVAGAVLVIGLAYHQRTLQRLPNYPIALATRGEDWRAANAWVRSNARATDLIFLDAGLIEAHQWLDRRKFLGATRPTAQQLDYLAFAASGPYDIRRRALPTTLGSPLRTYELPPEWGDVASHKGPDGRVIVITRVPTHLITPSPENTTAKVFGFGNVSVIVRP